VTAVADPAPPRAAVPATYASAFFSLSAVPMISLAVPLWAAQLALSPVLIGIAMGVPALIPLAYSIQVGGLMDRFGVRRLMLGFSLCGTAAPLLYPLLPNAPGLIVLQMLTGFAYSMNWVGAQTAIGRLARGSPGHAGRFGFASSAGTFVGPLLVGWTWDQGGAWPAFGLIGAWSAALFAAVWFLPVRQGPAGHPPDRLRWSDVIPDIGVYLTAARMLVSAQVQFVIYCTFTRICVVSIQASFYTVYLEQTRFSAAEIGFLIAVSSLVSSPATLVAGLLARLLPIRLVLLASIGAGAAALALTPVLDSLVALTLASMLLGFGVGVSFPLTLASLSSATSREAQGLGMGLRATANRAASLALPVVMGLVVQAAGITAAFWIVGGTLLVAIAWIGVAFSAGRRHPEEASGG